MKRKDRAGRNSTVHEQKLKGNVNKNMNLTPQNALKVHMFKILWS